MSAEILRVSVNDHQSMMTREGIHHQQNAFVNTHKVSAGDELASRLRLLVQFFSRRALHAFSRAAVSDVNRTVDASHLFIYVTVNIFHLENP